MTTVVYVCHYFINFTFRTFLFSLFSEQNELNLRLLPSSSFSLDTHKHIHTQTNQHKDTQTHPHEQTNKEINQCWCWLLVDRWIDAGGARSEFMGRRK